MKFSWTWLNQTINMNNINIDQMIDKLTLAGFELDGIESIKATNDTIIDISITPNRSDVLSIIGLAREIHTIFKRPIIKQFIQNNLYITNQNKTLSIDNQNIKYINYLQLNHLSNEHSPKWIQNYLLSYQIQPYCLLSDIIEYIKLKWNYNIYISNLNISINIQKKIFNLNNNTYKTNHTQILNKYKNTKLLNNNIIIYSFINNSLNISNSYNDFQQAYNEAINLIQTYGKATIGKLYQYYNPNSKIDHNIYLTKHKINNLLGPIQKSHQKYLSTLDIMKILNQLNFKPIYNQKNKKFQVTIPKYREHDITREIDVIEEISRIYGFNNFNDIFFNLNQYKKGNIEKSTKQIISIRHTLRNLGLHETLNSSFIYYNEISTKIIQKINIELYNPMNEYQKLLRINIIENLIQNYIYNYKQKNIQCEFFEIGKIFTKNLSIQSKYKECINLAGILTNNIFLRKSWSDKPDYMTWFHAKGLMEEFFYKINSNITWKIYKPDSNNIHIFPQNQIYIFNPIKTAIIYDEYQDIPIGIFGQIDKKIFKNSDFDSYIDTNLYAFEINLYQLLNTIKQNKHIQYIVKPYSTYPSITRDISFNLKNQQNIDTIIKQIQNLNQQIIESVQIFNEYYDQTKNVRSIGLRIIYRSQNRTLKSEEVESTNVKINTLLEKI